MLCLRILAPVVLMLECLGGRFFSLGGNLDTLAWRGLTIQSMCKRKRASERTSELEKPDFLGFFWKIVQNIVPNEKCCGFFFSCWQTGSCARDHLQVLGVFYDLKYKRTDVLVDELSCINEARSMSTVDTRV